MGNKDSRDLGRVGLEIGGSDDVPKIADFITGKLAFFRLIERFASCKVLKWREIG
jgi:hypothetical protein